MNAYWRAANYLSVGQIYLYDNPMLKEPLKLSHVKPLVVGHWGNTLGQNRASNAALWMYKEFQVQS
jgi:xylulose-5-phosphate/fructose-6-phosphate phosphoketolase